MKEKNNILGSENSWLQDWNSLLDSTMLLRQVFNHTRIGFLLVTEEGLCVRANEALCRILGYSLGALDEMLLADLLHPEYNGFLLDLSYQLGVNKVNSLEKKLRCQRSDGDYCWFNVSLCAIRLDERETLYYSLVLEDIDKMKSVEEALAQKEIRYQSIIENSPEVITRYDLEGKRIFGNSQFEKITGLNSLEVIGFNFDEVGTMGLNFSSLYKQKLHKVLSEKAPVEFENEGTGIDGRPCYFKIKLVPEFDFDGKITGALGFGWDVSAMKQVGFALEESQRLLKNVMDYIPQAIFWKDRYLVYLGCNSTFAEDAGLASPDEIIGKTDYDLPWTEQADLYRSGDQLVMDSGSPKLNYEEPQTTPSGNQIWLRTNKIPMQDASGNIIAVLGTYEDITERKQMEETLHESENRYRTLYNTTPAMLHSVDQDGKLLDVSDYWLAIMGYTRDEVIGKKSVDFLTKKSRKYAVEVVLPEFIKTGSCHDIEYQYVKKDGTVIDCLLSATFEKDSGGKEVRSLVVITDVTNEKQLKEILLLSEKRLSEAASIALLGYWEADLENKMFTFTDQFYNLLRTTESREGGCQMTVDLYVKKFVHPDDAHLVGVEIANSLETKDPNFIGQFEHRIIRADGSNGFFLVRFRIIKDKKGRTIKVHGINQDITERKLTEEGLQLRENQLVEAAKIAKLGYWEANIQSKMFTFTDQWFDLLGTTSANEGGYLMSSQYFMQKYVHPDDVTLAQDEIRKSIETDDPNYVGNFVHRMIKVDGSECFVQVQFAVEKDKHGATVRTYGITQDITSLKKAELVIQESRSRLIQTAIISKLGYWDYNGETDLFTFDDCFYAMVHTTAEEQGGYQMSPAEYIERFLFLDDVPLILEGFNKAVSSIEREYNASLEYRIRYANGGIGYVLVRILVKRDDKGCILSHTGTTQDITEQKLIEQEQERLAVEVQQSEKLLRTIMDSTPDCIFIKDREHRYLMVNKGYANALQMAPNDFIGKNDLDLGFPEELVKGNSEKGIRGFWTDDRLVMDSGQVQIYPDDLATIDGEEHTFHTIKSPLRNAEGEIFGVLAFARDITKMRQAQEQLEIFGLALENAHDAIQLFDDKMCYIYVNQQTCQLIDYTREEFLGMRATEFNVGITKENLDLIIKKLREDKEPAVIEEKIHTKDGRILEVEITLTPFFNNGKFTVISVCRDLTEFKEYQRQLEMVNNALDHIDSAVIINDIEGLLVYVNRKACESLRYSKEELLTKHIWDIDVNFTKGARMQMISELKSNDSAEFHLRSRQQDSNGWTFPVEITGALYSYLGKSYSVALVRNIFNQLQLDELLIRNEEDFIVLVEDSPDIIIRFNLNLQCIYVNKAWEEITGYMQYEMLDKTPKQTRNLPLSVGRGLEMLLKQVTKTGQKIKQEFQLPNAVTGQQVYLMINIVVERNLNNEIYGAMIVAHDITEIKIKEEQLREKQTILEEAQRLGIIGSWEFNLITNEREWSKEAYNIFEMNVKEPLLFGETFMERVHPDDCEKVNKVYSGLSKDQPDFEIEFRIMFPMGRVKYIIERGVLQFDDNKKSIKWIGTVQDITQWKEAEKELIEAKERAEESNRLKSNFLGIINHEIRTPLNAIAGFSSLLNDDSLSNDERGEFVGLVEKSVDELTDILDDIIDLSKIESGVVTIRSIEYDPVKLLQDQYENLEEFARKKGRDHLKLNLEIAKGKEGLQYINDICRIKKVIQILFENAVKFTKEGEITLGLRFVGANQFAFYVTDTGIGIPLDKQQVIFEPFVQSEEYCSREYQGLGIGLSVAYKLALSMGGSLTLESSTDKGSTFLFTVPVKYTEGKKDTTN